MHDFTQRTFRSGGDEALRAAVHGKTKTNYSRCIEDAEQDLCTWRNITVASQITLGHLDNCFCKIVDMSRSKIVISGYTRNCRVVAQRRCIRPHIEPEGPIAVDPRLDDAFIGRGGGKILSCRNEVLLVAPCKRLHGGASSVE